MARTIVIWLLATLTLALALLWTASLCRPWRSSVNWRGMTYGLVNAGGRATVSVFSQDAEDDYYRQVNCRYWIAALPLGSLDALAAWWLWRRRSRKRAAFPMDA